MKLFKEFYKAYRIPSEAVLSLKLQGSKKFADEIPERFLISEIKVLN